ncbi:hypothetical protein BAMA_10450 [Bacillus manliponensis]|uniref:Membrane insertase YidC/Oxa/ALB C-terminal domain-containing protein n=1 Tax=Bacillus manliponensis TaxID=574376 RepID=A0A073JUJ6_9BACI|nr:YidC/Oxa1 family membrane protein insertase [Bacillus manliponensis]KEK17897.1 hypothetical protein BAMA_10450 [Bacillus manliponensis]
MKYRTLNMIGFLLVTGIIIFSFVSNFFIDIFYLIINKSATILNDNYVLAIFIVTIILKTIFLLISFKSDWNIQYKKIVDNYYQGFFTQSENQKELEERVYKYYGIDNHRFSGCLAMLIQLAFVINFIQSLVLVSNNANHNHMWFNIGNEDPLFILPVILFICTFVNLMISNIKLTKKIHTLFLVFSLIIGVISSQLISAILIYWITNNLCSILQKIVCQKILYWQFFKIAVPPSEITLKRI